MRRALTFVLLLAATIVVSCATIEIKTPRDRIALAQLGVKTAYATAADYKARGALSASAERAVLTAADEAQASIDAARGLVSGGASPSTVDAALKLMEARLLALERARKTQGVQ